MFTGKLDTIKSLVQNYVSLKAGEEPKFFKPRSVSYVVRGAIDEELDHLEQQGILEKVTHSEWETPIVTVPNQMADTVSVEILGNCKSSIS